VFLTTEEVLEYLQVNLRTVYRLIKAGKIPAVRVGRQWRFRRADLDTWLDSQRTAKSEGTTSPHSETRQRVLVVDDEEGIRDLLSRTLALAEYEVDTTSDGVSALDLVRNDGYSLVIADLRMPGMDGLTLIREVKQIDPKLPIIIITGYSSESSAIEAVNLGVAGYLTKPVGIPQVLAAAAKALGAPAA
jgi:excisionase family DNA binding protein